MGKVKKQDPIKIPPVPKRYSKSDILKIEALVQKKSISEVAEIYGVNYITFKNHLYILRKNGYRIPILRKGRPVVKKDPPPKKEPERLPDRKREDVGMKWVRIDKRTMIQVKEGVNENEAIEAFYKRREESENFNYRMAKSR